MKKAQKSSHYVAYLFPKLSAFLLRICMLDFGDFLRQARSKSQEGDKVYHQQARRHWGVGGQCPSNNLPNLFLEML